MRKIQYYFENQAFGVCTKIGEKFGIPIASIRIFFIYASFITFGSPVIIYFALAFLMNLRKRFRRRPNTIWDF